VEVRDDDRQRCSDDGLVEREEEQREQDREQDLEPRAAAQVPVVPGIVDGGGVGHQGSLVRLGATQ
jgi:hypothetical protein